MVRETAFAMSMLALLGVVPSGAAPVSRGTTVRVSPAAAAPGNSTYGSVSAGGIYVAFDSETALVPGDVNGDVDVYLRHMPSGSITLLSSGAPGSRSFDPAITADGDMIAYVTRGAGQGMYVHDRVTNTSVALSNSLGIQPTVSPDGRWAAMSLGAGFEVIDRATGTRTTQAGDEVSISQTGKAVFFTSMRLTPDDPDTSWDIYMRDLLGGTLRLLTGGIAEPALHPVISADGNHMAFATMPPVQIHPIRLHVMDLTSAEVRLLSEGAEPYDLPAISADGSVVAFASPGLMFAAMNVPGTDPLTLPGIYVWDRATNGTTLASVRSGGVPGVWARPEVEPRCFIHVDPVCIPFDPGPLMLGINAANPQISPDGRWVVFDSRQRLVETDTDDAVDVYLHDRVEKTSPLGESVVACYPVRRSRALDHA